MTGRPELPVDDDLARVLSELGGEGLGPALKELGFPAALVDAGGVVRWENEAAIATSGSALGAEWASLVTSEARPELQRWFDDVMRRREAGERVTEVQLTGGGHAPVEISVVPLLADGFVVGAFGVGSRTHGRAGPSGRGVTLTNRQRDVLRLLSDGESTAQIARELVLSETTVRNHVSAILSALGVHSRLQAVLEAQKGRLLDDRRG